jgi:hypothetical protein
MKRSLLFFLPLLVAAGTFAQPAGVEITPLIGYRSGGTIDRDVTGLFGEDVVIESSPVLGLILDIDLSREFQLEFLVNHQESDLEFDDQLFEPDDEIGDVEITYWHAGILWRYSVTDVQPFLGLSVGGATIDPQIPGADAENRLSGSLAGGVKVFFSRNVGFRFEARGYWTDLGGDDEDDCFRCDDFDDQSEGLYQGEASVGLVLSF